MPNSSSERSKIWSGLSFKLRRTDDIYMDLRRRLCSDLRGSHLPPLIVGFDVRESLAQQLPSGVSNNIV